MADIPIENPPPGWHQDPSTPGRLRWWDGTVWTPHVAAAPSTTSHSFPAYQLADAARWCSHAAKAMWAFAAVIAIQAVIIAFAISTADEAGGSSEVGGTDPATDAGSILLGLSISVGSLISTAALIVLAIWTYKSTMAMRSFGHQTSHSPGWAAAGWFVPVVSLVIPYQAVRDLVPVHHPARSSVGRWWACWLIGPFACLATGVAALVALPVALLVATLTVTVSVLAARLGGGIVRTAGEKFRRVETVTGT